MTTILTKVLLLSTFAFTLAGEVFGTPAPDTGCLDDACCCVFVPCEKIATIHSWNDHGFCLGADLREIDDNVPCCGMCSTAGLFVHPKKCSIEAMAKVIFEGREDSRTTKEVVAERDPVDCPTCSVFVPQ